MGELARMLGAGRINKDDIIDLGVGFELSKKVGDLVFVFAPSNVTLSADTSAQQSKFNDSLWRTSLQ